MEQIDFLKPFFREGIFAALSIYLIRVLIGEIKEMMSDIKEETQCIVEKINTVLHKVDEQSRKIEMLLLVLGKEEK